MQGGENDEKEEEFDDEFVNETNRWIDAHLECAEETIGNPLPDGSVVRMRLCYIPLTAQERRVFARRSHCYLEKEVPSIMAAKEDCSAVKTSTST